MMTWRHKKIGGLILFLEWDPGQAAEARLEIVSLMQRCDRVRWTLLRINNSKVNLPLEKLRDQPFAEYQVGGDNTSGEFSGWDKGWKVASEEIGVTADVVVIANDALKNSKPYEQISVVDDTLIRYLWRWDSVVGWMDNYCDMSPEPMDLLANPMMLFGQPSRTWICTAFMVLSASVFGRILPLTQLNRENSVYHDEFAGQAFRRDCGLNDVYQQFLLDHQSQVWTKKYDLNSDTYPLFKTKTRMIINEHLLGCRIVTAEARCIDLRAVCRMSERQTRRANLLKILPYLRFRYLAYVSAKATTLRMLRGRDLAGAALVEPERATPKSNVSE